MKKFVQKHEILCAVLWIVLYCGLMVPLRNLGDDSPFMMLGLIGISAAMLVYVLVLGRGEYYGLAGWAKNNRAMLWFLPLWIVASVNLWAGVTPHYPLPGLIYAVVSMALVGFAEELIFRGFLFKAMLKDGDVRTAVIVSSVTFGIGHIGNLLTGHALFETLMQMLFAIAYGFLVTMAFYKGGSLLPCILSHSLTDVFSKLSTENAPKFLNWIAHAVIIVLAIAYCLYLARRVETPEINRPSEDSV